MNVVVISTMIKSENKYLELLSFVLIVSSFLEAISFYRFTDMQMTLNGLISVTP